MSITNREKNQEPHPEPKRYHPSSSRKEHWDLRTSYPRTTPAYHTKHISDIWRPVTGQLLKLVPGVAEIYTRKVKMPFGKILSHLLKENTVAEFTLQKRKRENPKNQGLFSVDRRNHPVPQITETKVKWPVHFSPISFTSSDLIKTLLRPQKKIPNYLNHRNKSQITCPLRQWTTASSASSILTLHHYLLNPPLLLLTLP